MKDFFQELTARYPRLLPCERNIRAAYALLENSFLSGGKLMLCGNGGSAADCGHIVGELMKGFLNKRPLRDTDRAAFLGRNPDVKEEMLNQLQRALPAVNLCENSPLLSAFANDVNPEYVYAQQVLGLGRKGDVLIGISTSGNSENVVAALQLAKAIGVKTVALAGRDGGKIGKIADVAIIAPETDTFKIQELHLPVYHALCAALEARFFR